MNKLDDDRPFAHRGGHALDRAAANIAHGINSRQTGLEQSGPVIGVDSRLTPLLRSSNRSRS